MPNLTKLCECGCGQPTPLHKRSNKRLGIKIGDPCRFINGHGKCKDMKGKRFGRLLVLEKAKERKHGQARWKCLCDCGNIKIVYGNSLRRKTGPTVSCGCYIKEVFKQHGEKRKDRTHCINNHKYTKETVYIKKNNSRGCKLCDKQKKKKYRDSIHGYIAGRKYRLNKMREENLLRLQSLQEENPWLTN